MGLTGSLSQVSGIPEAAELGLENRRTLCPAAYQAALGKSLNLSEPISSSGNEANGAFMELS